MNKELEKLYQHYIYSIEYYKHLTLNNVLDCFITIYSRIRGGWSYDNSLTDLIFQLEQYKKTKGNKTMINKNDISKRELKDLTNLYKEFEIIKNEMKACYDYLISLNPKVEGIEFLCSKVGFEKLDAFCSQLSLENEITSKDFKIE